MSLQGRGREANGSSLTIPKAISSQYVLSSASPVSLYLLLKKHTCSFCRHPTQHRGKERFT